MKTAGKKEGTSAGEESPAAGPPGKKLTKEEAARAGLLAVRLLEDLGPMCRNLSRQVTKEEEILVVKKKPRVTLEDFEEEVGRLEAQFLKQNDALRVCLSQCQDAAEQYGSLVNLQQQLRKVEEALTSLTERRDRCRKSFDELLTWLPVTDPKNLVLRDPKTEQVLTDPKTGKKLVEKKTTSTEFFVLWDDLLVPGDLILRANEKDRKAKLEPLFFRPRALTRDDLLLLWGFTPSAEEAKAMAKAKVKAKAMAKGRAKAIGKEKLKPGADRPAESTVRQRRGSGAGAARGGGKTTGARHSIRKGGAGQSPASGRSRGGAQESSAFADTPALRISAGKDYPADVAQHQAAERPAKKEDGSC